MSCSSLLPLPYRGFVLLCFVLTSTSCSNDPIVPTVKWDFSKGHTIDLVNWPEEMEDEDGLAQLQGGDRQVVVRLAGDLEYRAITEAIYARKSGDRLSTLLFIHKPGSLESCILVSKKILDDFGYTAEALDDWRSDLSEEADATPPFEKYYQSNLYRINLRIQSTYSKTEPFQIMLKLYLAPPGEDNDAS